MIPDIASAGERVEVDGRAWSVERQDLGRIFSSSGRVFFTDAFERIWPDEVPAVPRFRFESGVELDVTVLWIDDPSASVRNRRMIAALLLERSGATPTPTWIRANPSPEGQVVYSQGTLMLAFAEDRLGDVIALQADPDRILSFARRGSEVGPQLADGVIAVPGPDGPLDCWSSYDAGGALSGLLFDFAPFTT